MRRLLSWGVLAVLLLFSAARGVLAAEIYWIQGSVSLADGRPVENVAIYMDGQPAATSGVSGLFIIPEAAAGEHLIQPVKTGYTFVPESVKVLLPPNAGDVNFAAFQSIGGEEPTVQVPVVQESPPPPSGDNFWTTLMGLGALWRQLQVLLMLLTLGAFLVLAARWLASKTWSQPPAEAAESAQDGLEEPAVAWEEVSTPAADEPSVVDSPEPVVEAAEPAAEAAPGGEEIETWLKEGVTLVRNGEAAQGMALLRQVTQAKPEHAEAWFWLGAGNMALRERRTAERCFKQALRLGHPKAEQALEMLGEKP